VFAGWALVEGGAGASHDHSQQIIEIMRDATCQNTDALQFLCLPQAFFGFSALGNVPANANHAYRAAVIAVSFEEDPPV
jgi:hypothetical protein